MKTFPSQQRGVALLTTLLVVAMATIIAVNITDRQQYDIRRMENVLFSIQAQNYALGGESWAKSLLARDLKDDNKNGGTDNLFEDWAQPLPVTFIEGGTIAGRINDLQGRFNLNNLYIANRDDLNEVNQQQEYVIMFKRLLGILDIQEPITPAIVDWVDADTDVTFPGGAEDEAYLSRELSYRAANRRMSSISELLLVEGVTYEIYEKLRPFISVMPEKTTINVNTAEAEIIAALSSQLNPAEGATIVEDRTEAFKDIDDFFDATSGLATDQNQYQLEVTPLISVTSQYFQINASVQIDNINSKLTSSLKRHTDYRIEVISRSPGVD